MPNEIIKVEQWGMDMNWIMLPDGTVRRPYNAQDWFWWSKMAILFGWRTIGDTQVGDMRVSTVFLGLDHDFNAPIRLVLHGKLMYESAEPIGYQPTVFETMIFGGELNGWKRRYKSLRRARFGHKQAVLRARSRVAADREGMAGEDPEQGD